MSLPQSRDELPGLRDHSRLDCRCLRRESSIAGNPDLLNAVTRCKNDGESEISDGKQAARKELSPLPDAGT